MWLSTKDWLQNDGRGRPRKTFFTFFIIVTPKQKWLLAPAKKWLDGTRASQQENRVNKIIFLFISSG
jgi:hypothetical protein